MRRVSSVSARVLASWVLPTPASPFEEERALEREREEDGRRQGAVGDVVAGAEGGLETLDRGQLGGKRPHLVHQPAATSARAASKPSAISVISASVMTNGGETWRATPRSTRVRIP